MIKINFMLIDGDKLALSLMKGMLAPYKGLQLIGAFTDANQAWTILDNYPVDVVFLDIDMRYINGLEVASRIGRYYADIEIVFVTTDPRYAVEAFDLNVMDYLLKPLEHIRLDQTVTKLMRRVKKRQTHSAYSKEMN